LPSINTLPLLLKHLGLSTISARWELLAEQAINESWSAPVYLAHLCELEIATRQQRRIARHTKESKLLPGKSLATFDFNSTPSVNPAQIQALADNPTWVKEAKNVIFFGPSGVGKSHLAAAIGHRLIEHGTRVLFTSTTTLVQKLQDARKDYKLPEALAKLSKIPLLILDDISYVKKDELETSVLFELIAERYEAGSLIITSNQPFGEWDDIFPNNMMAVAAIDRLVHHATIISVTGQSYRTKHTISEPTNKEKITE
jgi:DNA replication protein DnaC